MRRVMCGCHRTITINKTKTKGFLKKTYYRAKQRVDMPPSFVVVVVEPFKKRVKQLINNLKMKALKKLTMGRRSWS
jgi:hypothetical protein